MTQKDFEIEKLSENQASAIRCSSPLCVDPVSGVYTGEEFHEKHDDVLGNTRRSKNTEDEVKETKDEKTQHKCVVINSGSKEWF